MKPENDFTPVEVLHSAKRLILLGRRIEELQARGYSRLEIEHILQPHHDVDTVRLAGKFLSELRSLRGKA